jgi:recombinational DNA repair protein (RecF pathway)
MREYVSEAIILNKRPNGNMDTRYAIFTKKFGKMLAKATSARKVTSKLAGHLEPGTVARVRLIEKNGLRVVDALRECTLLVDGKSNLTLPLKDEGWSPTLYGLALLDRLLAEAEPEPFVWAMVRRGKLDWRSILGTLGWDPGKAACSVCRAIPVSGFSVACQDFFFSRCFSEFSLFEFVIIVYFL